MIDKTTITNSFKDLQDRICKGIEELDGKAHFQEDLWQHKNGGGGRTRVIQEGGIIEKGGVNFSAVEGDMPPKLLEVLKVEADASAPISFYATGVSIVLHPRSPRTPIIHMNVRYFEMSNGTWWFGGGIDLTPHYVEEQLASDFHTHLKEVCMEHNSSYYSIFKKWADDYFYIPHRKETRGIGGIFFDRLKDTAEFSKKDRWDFVLAVGNSFVDLYRHQVDQTRALSYGQNELDWQGLRRGRYVEFNLAWDRGTKFGLETNGRTESILMSLPPVANWTYSYKAEPNSEEERTLNSLKKGVDWTEIITAP
jgi:coproporphyrinogen III oxidase